MLPRERILKILRREGKIKPSPWNLFLGATPSFTPLFWKKFVAETGIRDVAEYFDFEIRLAHSESVDPLFHTTTANYGIKMNSNGIGRDFFSFSLPEEVTFSPWGVGLLSWPDNPGYERMFHPLAGNIDLQEVERYPVPGIDEESMFKVRSRAETIHRCGYLPAAYCGSIYEWCHWLRGMEDFMIDLLSAPEMARALIAKVADFTYEFARAHALCGVELLCFYDDYGMQDRLQIPPKIWRQFIKPWWKKILDALRREFPQCVFFLHSCGQIEAILPDIIEVGFDVLHPLQPECQDVESIVAKYREYLTFWGTISAQITIPLGTRAEVQEEARHRMRLATSFGNLIVSPSNTIGGEVPVENVLALIEVCQGMS